MKILYINTFDPYVENFGGSVVTKAELKLLQEHYDVDLLYAESLFKRVLRNPLKVLYTYITTFSLKLSSYAMLKKNKEFYNQYDLIWCNHDFSAIDFKIFLKLNKPFVVRKHNSEYKIINKYFLFGLEKIMIKKFEQDISSNSILTIHISDTEYKNDFTSFKKDLIYPPLFNTSMEVPSYKSSKKDIDILCISNFNWKPNIDGMDWFLNNIFNNKNNSHKLHLIGKGSCRYKKLDNIVTYGYVEDLEEYYSRARYFLVPIITGAGIKIKTIDAIKNGVQVISTEQGIEGIEFINQYVLIINKFIDFNSVLDNDTNKEYNIYNAFEVCKQKMSENIFLDKVNKLVSNEKK